MQNVNITIDKALAYELEIIIRDRIQALLAEQKATDSFTVNAIIGRQLQRSYALHNAVMLTIDTDIAY
jgi:hypothetical protein